MSLIGWLDHGVGKGGGTESSCHIRSEVSTRMRKNCRARSCQLRGNRMVGRARLAGTPAFLRR